MLSWFCVSNALKNSSCVSNILQVKSKPLIEGLCAQILYFRFENIGGLCSHLLLFFVTINSLSGAYCWTSPQCSLRTARPSTSTQTTPLTPANTQPPHAMAKYTQEPL